MSIENKVVISEPEDTSIDFDGSEDGSTSDQLELDVKPPDHEKYASDIERINNEIKEKEKEIKLLNLKPPSREYFAMERDRLHNDLKVTKESWDSELTKKKKIDEELRTTNQNVQLKNEEIRKLQSKLPYNNEKKIDAAISRLENQLQRGHVKPAERKEISQEIEHLKSLKENLETYRASRTELDGLKDKQRTLRTTREEHSLKLTSVRQEEDAIKSSLKKLKTEEDMEWSKYKTGMSLKDSLKRQTDELYKSRKEIHSNYHHQELAFRKQMKSSRRKSRPLMLPVLRVVKSTSLKTIKQEKKIPYEEEIVSCAMLISYLEKSLGMHQPSEVENSFTSSGSAEHLDHGQDEHLSGIYYGVRRRPSKRSRRQKKFQAAPEHVRKCTHHPNVLSQFITVDVSPPVNVADVSQTIKQLEEKREFFQTQQKAVDEFASTLLTRRKSLEHLNDKHAHCNEIKEAPTGELCLQNLGEVSSEIHNTVAHLELEENHKSTKPLGIKGKDDGSLLCNGDETQNPVNVAENVANDDTLVNRTNRSKVKFCIGEDSNHVDSRLSKSMSVCFEDKMLIPFDAVVGLGRSKSLDSFRALNHDMDIPVSCRRARSISEKLSHPNESYADFGVIRSEL